MNTTNTRQNNSDPSAQSVKGQHIITILNGINKNFGTLIHQKLIAEIKHEYDTVILPLRWYDVSIIDFMLKTLFDYIIDDPEQTCIALGKYLIVTQTTGDLVSNIKILKNDETFVSLLEHILKERYFKNSDITVRFHEDWITFNYSSGIVSQYLILIQIGIIIEIFSWRGVNLKSTFSIINNTVSLLVSHNQLKEKRFSLI